MQPESKHLLLSASIVVLSAISEPLLAKSITQEVEDALNFYHYGKNGAVKFDLNYRWENVDQYKVTNPALNGTPTLAQPRTANANTARLRLGLLSPIWNKFQGFAEFEGNLAMQEDYNSNRNGKTGYSVIADPEKMELNQLWINYTGFADTEIKGGRQRIKLDDDRFIGNVGWRQMEMTYDGVLVTHKNQQIFGLTINAAYLGNVNTITSTTENINAPLLNLNYKVGDYGNAVAYGYWLDYIERENYEKSSETYGFRFSNFQKPGDTYLLNNDFGLVYTAEYSFQQDHGHGLTNYEADRYNVMGGFTAFNFTFQGAMEQLDGKGLNKTFDTPLGTNHAFQGWADLFLVTPNNGIRDVFGTVIGQFDRGNTIATFTYHDFSDDTGNIPYGHEYNAQVLKKFGRHYSFLAKYAYYEAEQYSTDKQVIWLQANVTF